MTTTKTIYIGVDPGITGGLVALSEMSSIISMRPIPTQTARKSREVDVAEVCRWMNDIDARDTLTVVCEEPGGSRNARAASSLSGSFHAIRALCAVRHIRFHRITPQAWQRVMLPGCAPGQTKPRALEAARRLWPDESFIAPGCRTPHTGLVDAALIAEFGRRTL